MNNIYFIAADGASCQGKTTWLEIFQKHLPVNSEFRILEEEFRTVYGDFDKLNWIDTNFEYLKKRYNTIQKLSKEKRKTPLYIITDHGPIDHMMYILEFVDFKSTDAEYMAKVESMMAICLDMNKFFCCNIRFENHHFIPASYEGRGANISARLSVEVMLNKILHDGADKEYNPHIEFFYGNRSYDFSPGKGCSNFWNERKYIIALCKTNAKIKSTTINKVLNKIYKYIWQIN